jgi:hypothetical protein
MHDEVPVTAEPGIYELGVTLAVDGELVLVAPHHRSAVGSHYWCSTKWAPQLESGAEKLPAQRRTPD